MILLNKPIVPLYILDTLRKLGARDETVGFHYTAYGVFLVLEQPQRLAFVTKWLYPAIGRKYQTTASAVERGIRLTIKYILSETRTPLFVRIFSDCKCLTSSRFISTVAEYLASEGLHKSSI